MCLCARERKREKERDFRDMYMVVAWIDDGGKFFWFTHTHSIESGEKGKCRVIFGGKGFFVDYFNLAFQFLSGNLLLGGWVNSTKGYSTRNQIVKNVVIHEKCMLYHGRR